MQAGKVQEGFPWFQGRRRSRRLGPGAPGSPRSPRQVLEPLAAPGAPGRPVLLLPVGHGRNGAEGVAEVEGSSVAEVGNAQVEVQDVPLVPLRLRGHLEGGVLPVLQQGQVLQQSCRFLLAGAEEDPYPSLDQG